MKKLCVILVAFLLCGCGAVPTFETLGAVDHTSPSQPSQRTILLQLPDDAVKSVMSNELDTVYHCQDYTIILQTISAGDMVSTVRSISGFSPDQMTILESQCGDHSRWDWVWTAAGEGNDVVCRAAVLNDGVYHYTLQVMASAEDAGDLTKVWNELFRSFCLEGTEVTTPGGNTDGAIN